jgi:hypothetical protein
VPGCNKDPSGRTKPKDPDRIGLKNKINAIKGRRMKATKNCGVHWPDWRFKTECEIRSNEPPPKIQKRMKINGENGPVTDDSWGCPTNCSRIEYEISDGIEHEKGLVDGELLNDAGDLSDH